MPRTNEHECRRVEEFTIRFQVDEFELTLKGVVDSVVRTDPQFANGLAHLLEKWVGWVDGDTECPSVVEAPAGKRPARQSLKGNTQTCLLYTSPSPRD